MRKFEIQNSHSFDNLFMVAQQTWLSLLVSSRLEFKEIMKQPG